MPAKRSRTSGWKQSLAQLKDRQGPLEIGIAREGVDAQDASNLMWRVRLLDMDDQSLIVEQPSAMGRSMPLEKGIKVSVLFAIGQNRWSFTSTVQGETVHQINGRKRVASLRLAVPTNVERCRRRDYVRLATSAFKLPNVEMWPLLDPASVVVAERACELAFEENEQGLAKPKIKSKSPDILPLDTNLMPEVGPRFSATLENIGGGGVGLRVDEENSVHIGHHKVFWMRFALPPEMNQAICATAKLTHSHMDSQHSTHMGMSFDFSFNRQHERFVVDQICRYVACRQREQLRRQSA